MNTLIRKPCKLRLNNVYFQAPLINTPLLKTTSLKTEFDNKILVGFLALIIFLVIAGLIFIDVMKNSSNPIPEIENTLPTSPQIKAIMLV